MHVEDIFSMFNDIFAGVLPFLAPVVALPAALGFYRIHDNTWYRPHDDAAMRLVLLLTSTTAVLCS